ncbi:MAG: DNA-binding protein [Betaproteobacteria bacterium HGW-Betaproteobacteria-3]|jgi:Rrf2 family iron-sulfur cluster assembly transcriptional regulator|nr:MAG: DNA-binding protein [Betaproteobacteria bacterium HGW-Betaproteobacteria-3]
MRLTTQGRFAVAAMLDIALRARSGPVALAAISARQKVSVSYLEQMFSKLRRSGLVESTRGPGGGYSLGRNAETISVADIIAAIEQPGGPSHTREAAESEAALGDLSMTADLWAALNARMMVHLQGISLRSLVNEQLAKGVSVDAAPAKAKHAVYAKPPAPRIPRDVPNSVFALGSRMITAR